ncbi:MAG TPA: hypothetical protein VF483_09780 [Gemmatimonadaceae bacterium]
MADLQLRARSVSEIVDAAFDLYRRNPARYIALAALGVIPTLFVQLSFPTVSPGTGDMSTAVTSILKFALMMVISTIDGAMLIRLGAYDYLGEDADVARAVREVLPRIPALVFALFLRAFVYGVGILLLIFGFFYFYARYFAIDAAIVIEGLGPTEAFTRSSALSAGRKRHILNTVLLVGIVYVILSTGVALLAALAGSQVVTQVAQSALSLVAAPVLALVVTILYYDTRIRGEGFDLQRMAAALDTPKPASA